MPERDVEFNVTATDKSGPATRSAADGFEKMGRSAEGAARKVDNLGDQSGQLARKLLEARAAALGLARQFDRTGDTKLLKDFGKINAEAAKLGRVFKTLKFDPPEIKNPDGVLGKLVTFARQAGLIAGDAAVEGIGDAFNALPGPLKTGIVVALGGAAAAAAPIVAGAIEGAVLAGVASGGLAAGIILAARDPAVVSAYAAQGKRIMTALDKGFAAPFKGVLVQAADQFGGAFDRQEPRLRRISASLAPVLKGLITDAVAGVERIMPSIEKAAAVGGKILAGIGQQLPGLLGAVGNLLDAFVKGGPGAAAAIGIIIAQLRGMINLLAFGAQASAPFLNFFGKLLELSHLVPAAADDIGRLQPIIKDGGSAAGLSAVQYEELAQSLGNTANMARQLQSNFDALFGTEMGVQQANLAVNLGLQQVTETIKNNKKTLDQSTESGAQNAAVILQQVNNLNTKRLADIAAGNGTAEATAKANAAYAAQVSALRAVLIQMGLNAGQVDALIGKLESIPNITRTVTTVFRTQGTPPGYSDEKTGHSRTGSQDYGALDGWAPAQFAAAARAGFAAGGGTGPRTPPMDVHSEVNVAVSLDGAPFRSMSARVTRAAEARQAWRAYAGARK